MPPKKPSGAAKPGGGGGGVTGKGGPSRPVERKPQGGGSSISNHCSVSSLYPNFAFLTHQTSVKNLPAILREGRLLPPRFYKTASEIEVDINKRLSDPNNAFSYAGVLEGVYLTLVRKSDLEIKNNFIPWFNGPGKDQIIFVFPLSLLERNDYYLSLRDQFGSINHHTYAKQTLVKQTAARKPEIDSRGNLKVSVQKANAPTIFTLDVNTLPRSPEYTQWLPTGFNEVMFWEPIDLKMCIEVWLHPGSSDYRKYILDTLSTSILNELPVFTKNTYDNVQKTGGGDGGDLIRYQKGCYDKKLIDYYKSLKAPFCRSDMYIGNNGAMFYKPKENAVWRISHLNGVKGIAHNCKIDKDIIKYVRNPDLLMWFISQRELEYMRFFAEGKKKGKSSEQLNEEFRQKYILDQPKYPPFRFGFTEDPSLVIQTNKGSPFYGIVQIIVDQMERELEFALSGHQPTHEQHNEDLVKVYDSIQETYGRFLELVKVIYGKVAQKQGILAAYVLLDCLYHPSAKASLDRINEKLKEVLKTRPLQKDLDRLMSGSVIKGVTDIEELDEYVNSYTKSTLPEHNLILAYKLYLMRINKLVSFIEEELGSVYKQCHTKTLVEKYLKQTKPN